KRFILPLVLLLIIIIAVALNGAGGSDDPGAADPATTASAEAGPTAEADEPAFAGAEDSDVVGQAGETLTLGEIAVASTAIGAGDDTLGPTLCTAVTVNNESTETIDFNAFDWKLQAPSGTILNTGFSGSANMITGGQIAPGGSTTGDICFDNARAEAGQFVVLYEPIFSFFSDRAAWINNR
uniref:DUF4352 domain-containing protein n=1 Tax=uncultured Arthrobacter sp. TaxID=114050 RepID=UPI002601402B